MSTDGSDRLTVKVSRLDEDDPAVLYRHYESQLYQQPCVLVLDLRDGELTARYNPEPDGGAMPESVFNRQVLWLSMPCLTAASANALLDYLTPLAQRVLDGAAIVRRRDQEVGELTEDASRAVEEIADVINDPLALGLDLRVVAELDAEEWFAEGPLPDGLTADTTDDELDAMAEAEAAIAVAVNPETYTVLQRADVVLRARREALRGEV